ncbi:MAG: 2-hydroxychromene-2-carboxylate isomerase [Candidatus Binataceae bacterium]
MQTSPLVDFYFGIGSRYSYLASTQIARLESETGAHFEWHPLYSPDLYRLRGNNPFEGEPSSGQYQWAWRQSDAEAWAEYYGVLFVEPQRIPAEQQRILARACAAAKLCGSVESSSRMMFQRGYVENRPPADERACTEIAREAGLPAEKFQRLLTNGDAAAALTHAAEQAHSRGAFGVPTFFVDHRMYFGNDRIVLLRHHLLNRKST